MKKINVKYIDTTKYICKVTLDEYADDPSEFGGYQDIFVKITGAK